MRTHLEESLPIEAQKYLVFRGTVVLYFYKKKKKKASELGCGIEFQHRSKTYHDYMKPRIIQNALVVL